MDIAEPISADSTPAAEVTAGTRCEGHFAAGFNCAESLLRGCNEALGLHLDPTAYAMATPFGGGFGGARSACGAVTGALMALGLARGRVTADQPAGPGAEAGRQLHDRFVARFGSVDCRELTRPYVWDRPERREACRAYVHFAADEVASILRARGSEASPA